MCVSITGKGDATAARMRAASAGDAVCAVKAALAANGSAPSAATNSLRSIRASIHPNLPKARVGAGTRDAPVSTHARTGRPTRQALNLAARHPEQLTSFVAELVEHFRSQA